MSTTLEIQLPPLAALQAASVLDYRHGARHGQATRAQLAAEAGGATWRLHLHEDDSLVVAIALPPLTGKRLEAAVRCAVQGLLLGDPGQVHVAHGTRQSDGRVAVAWLGQDELTRLRAWLLADRIRLGGLFAQPLDTLSPPDLGGGLQGPAKRLDVTRTVAIWGAAALVWCLGLNLYAAHLASEGEGLRMRMVAQVRQAFPQLPVVLNPLQQARQQLQGASGAAVTGVDALLEGAGRAMPFLAGNVAAIAYEDGVLSLTPMSERSKASTDSAWQADLAARGIDVKASGQGWRLRASSATNEELAHVD
ncbi:GspL/Epsl periplasmic domain-containing protein [Pseudomonas sp. microsymbiont 2]